MISLPSISSIAIIGGGTAGWMTAAALSRKLPRDRVKIRLVESAEIGIIGVGESTIPHIRYFNQMVGIDEADFMRRTHATFKLGIEFTDWGRIGARYVHPFGDFGRGIAGVGFHHYWNRLRQTGEASDIGDYSVAVVAARRGKFGFPSTDERSVLSSFSYAFQFDATKYAPYLRTLAEARGVERTEGTVVDVNLRAEDGHIASVILKSGEVVTADFFFDCTGFHGRLIEQAMKTGYEDWSRWLPCDRAVAVPCEMQGPPVAYTRATARQAGWQWRIPLQHRVGNGHVYASAYMDDDQAGRTLLETIEGRPLAEPRVLKFQAGIRRKTWNRNCLAVGLSGGFLEPLESTSIHLIQVAIGHFLEMMPAKEIDPVDCDEYNRRIEIEFLRIRDFLILHYHATARDDSDFWNYCRTMSIPDSLAYKIEQFQRRGYVVPYKDGIFRPASWIALYLGQGVVPERYDPLADQLDLAKVRDLAAGLRALVSNAVDSLPPVATVLDGYCRASA